MDFLKTIPTLYAYKRLTSGLKTHISLTWNDGKIYLMKMEIKSRASVAILRQNTL